MKSKFWIQKAVNPANKGLLHEKLGVPQGEKIPAAQLETAASAGGSLGKEARFAENIRGLNSKKSTGIKSIADMRSKIKGMGY